MIKRPVKATRNQQLRNLIVCEGETECWFLSDLLDSRKFKIEVATKSKTNAEMLVTQDAVNKSQSKEFSFVYCVFDKDQNTMKQLQSANKFINATKNKEFNRFIRVFSNSNFEVVFYYAQKNIIQNIGYDFNKFISKSYLKKETYEKRKLLITKITSQINPIKLQLYSNAKNVYDKLNIDNDNWCSKEEAYTEIFKLLES